MTLNLGNHNNCKRFLQKNTKSWPKSFLVDWCHFQSIFHLTGHNSSFFFSFCHTCTPASITCTFSSTLSCHWIYCWQTTKSFHNWNVLIWSPKMHNHLLLNWLPQRSYHCQLHLPWSLTKCSVLILSSPLYSH